MDKNVSSLVTPRCHYPWHFYRERKYNENTWHSEYSSMLYSVYSGMKAVIQQDDIFQCVGVQFAMWTVRPLELIAEKICYQLRNNKVSDIDAFFANLQMYPMAARITGHAAYHHCEGGDLLVRPMDVPLLYRDTSYDEEASTKWSLDDVLVICQASASHIYSEKVAKRTSLVLPTFGFDLVRDLFGICCMQGYDGSPYTKLFDCEELEDNKND